MIVLFISVLEPDGGFQLLTTSDGRMTPLVIRGICVTPAIKSPDSCQFVEKNRKIDSTLYNVAYCANINELALTM